MNRVKVCLAFSVTQRIKVKERVFSVLEREEEEDDREEESISRQASLYLFPFCLSYFDIIAAAMKWTKKL